MNISMYMFVYMEMSVYLIRFYCFHGNVNSCTIKCWRIILSFQLIMWELSDGASVGGGFRYHSNVIRSELVEQFGREYCRVLSSVASDPRCDLQALAMSIQSPFSKHK